MISISKLCSFYFPFDKEMVLTNLVAKGRGTREEILAEWERKKERGIANHEKINSYLLSSQKDKFDTSGIEGYIRCIQWLEDKCGYNLRDAELTCKDKDLGIIGRIDALFEQNDHFLIVDWKPNTNDFPGEFCQSPLQHFHRNKHNQYVYQLMIQDLLVFNKLKKNSILAYVIQIGPTFEIFYAKSDRDLVKQSIEVYKEKIHLTDDSE